MALPVRQQMTYWSVAAVAFLFVLWTLGQVLLPLVVGGALAYVMDPLADRLERMGASRILATVAISLMALLIFVLILLLVIPVLVQQTTTLVQTVPEMVTRLQAFLTERFPTLSEADSPLRLALGRLIAALEERGGMVVNQVVSSALGLMNTLVFFVVAPVVAFYLLLDWDRMIARIDELLPRDHAPVVRQLATEIDRTLASFVRGQGTVCLILGAYYAVALMVVGLQFGLVVGLLAGLISFIPYVGALVGGALAIGLALFQFWGEWWWILAVAVIFQIGQLVEGNILTPNLVGSSVGLHPVWLIFALSAFGSMFGFVGMLIAVPVAAMIGVLARFFVGRYTEGRLFRGISGNRDGE